MFNGCKSTGCPNLGNSNHKDYEQTTRLGYPALHCPLCGSYPPILNVSPIISLMKQHRKSAFASSMAACNQCKNYYFSHYSHQEVSTHHGKTIANTTRRLCSNCGKTFTLLNEQQLHKRLQPLFDIILSSTLASDVINTYGISSNKYYRDLRLLADLLRNFSRTSEQAWLKQQKELYLISETNTVNCRSGYRGSDSKLWFISSFVCSNGYLLLQTNNLYFGNKVSPDEYNPTKAEEEIDSDENDLFKIAEDTYKKIFNRPKFDELNYSSPSESKSKEGTLIRPVYTSHCHFQLLKSQLRRVKTSKLFLQHESVLRGACMWSFNRLIRLDKCRLYYIIYLNPESRFYKHNTAKKIGWWNNQWFQSKCHFEHTQWPIAYSPQSKQKSDNLALTFKPDWKYDYWNKFEQWLPHSARRRMKMEILSCWLDIFNYIYNYSDKDRLNMTSVYEDIDLRSISSISKQINQTH